MTRDQTGFRQELDYEQIEAAVMETARGRWFLAEYARRHRSADTEAILRELSRLESLIRKPEHALPASPAAAKPAEPAPAQSPATLVPLDPPKPAVVEPMIASATPPVHIPPAVAAQLDALLARLAEPDLKRPNLAPIAAEGRPLERIAPSSTDMARAPGRASGRVAALEPFRF